MTAVRILLAIALLSACAGSAAAQTPALRAEVIVASDLVRLGDLIDGAGASANEAVFRSPDLGTTGTIQANRVVQAAAEKGLRNVDLRGLREITVTRASRTVTLDEMKRALTLAIIRQHGLGTDADLSVSFDASVMPAHLETTLDAPVQVIQINWSPTSGRFDAVLGVEGSSVLAKAPLRVGGMATETVTIPVFTRTMDRGEVVRSADVAMDRQPRSQASGNAIDTLEAAIGQALRRTARAGQPILASDLTKPNVVARNDAVTLVYEVPGMILTVRAKALDTGATGDTIAVLNGQSKRVVQATIAGPGRVIVRSAATVALN